MRPLLEGYVLEILARARSAEERSNTILSYDFFSETPRDLARTIGRACSFLSKAANNIFAQVDWENPEEDLQLLRQADNLVQQLASHLRFVHGARTDRLPWGIIPSFERLVKQLAPDKQVMLRPKWSYNYTVDISDLRDAYLTALEEYADYVTDEDVAGDVLKFLRRPFHIISFPSLERENILLHTLLGHEIGHLFADAFLTEERKTAFKVAVIEPIAVITDKEMQYAGLTESTTGALFLPEIRKVRIAANTNLALEFWTRALEEILSDIVGAILFGPAALFSTLEMAMQQGYDIQPSGETSFYPPWRLRLRYVLKIVESGSFFPVEQSLFRSSDSASRAERVNEKVALIRDICVSQEDSKSIAAHPIADLAYQRVTGDVEQAVEFLLISCKLGRRTTRAISRRLFKNMAALIERLDHDLTPNAPEKTINDRTSIDVVEIINAAWFHRSSLSETALDPKQVLDLNLVQRRRRADRLTLKAIELAGLAHDYGKSNTVEDYLLQMEEGSDEGSDRDEDNDSSPCTLATFMERTPIERRLIVTPLLNPRESLSATAIDVRLGNQFIVMRREAFPLMDIGDLDFARVNIERYQERAIKAYGEQFILHPRQLVIGSTLEYIQVPTDLMCYVIGKSTWGRLGLIIATATKVDPGYRGCLTLEIVNEGEVPLVLYPGVPIAQLVVHRALSKGRYSGEYSCAVGPEFPRFEGKRAAWRYWTGSKARA